jgi:hypothetical protein
LIPTKTAFVTITKPKETVPRVKILLIKTGMGNVTTAKAQENVAEPVAVKAREMATAAVRDKVKEMAAVRAPSTEMVVPARDVALQTNQRNKQQHFMKSKYAIDMAYFGFSVLMKKNDRPGIDSRNTTA